MMPPPPGYYGPPMRMPPRQMQPLPMRGFMPPQRFMRPPMMSRGQYPNQNRRRPHRFPRGKPQS